MVISFHLYSPVDASGPSRTFGSSNTNYCSSQNLSNFYAEEKLRKAHGRFSINVTLPFPLAISQARVKVGRFLGSF